MATLKITPEITPPSNMKIPLVRGDLAGVSSHFRVGFEIFLALFSAVLGSVLSTVPPATVDNFHWAALAVCFTFAGVCLYLHLSWQKKAS